MDLRFPIGKFAYVGEIGEVEREAWLSELEQTPARLREAVRGLSDEQLDTPYREGGWTIRQVVHHLADSHMNSYIRFKLALTEESPVIRPYDEQRWAELPEARTGPLELSLSLLDSLHARWAACLRGMEPEQWNRSFVHPASGVTRLDRNLGIYAWHGRHHTAHITSLRDRMGWG